MVKSVKDLLAEANGSVEIVSRRGRREDALR